MAGPVREQGYARTLGGKASDAHRPADGPTWPVFGTRESRRVPG